MRKWDPLTDYENKNNTINKNKFSSMLRTRFTKSNIKYFVPAETSRNTYQVSIFSFGKTLLVNTNLYHLKTILSSLLRYGLYLRRSYCICPIQNTVFGMFNIWNEYVRIMPCYNFFNLMCGSANMYIFNDYVMCKFWIYRLAATLAGKFKIYQMTIG